MMEEGRKNNKSKFFGELLQMVRLIGLFFGLFFGLYIVGVATGLTKDYRTYVIFVAAFVPGLVCFFLLPKELRQIKIPAGPKKASPKSLLSIPGIVFISIFLTVWLNRLMYLIPWNEVLSQEQVSSAEGNFEIPLFTAVIGYGILAPFSEEVCFRGILYGYLSKWMKAPIAIGISAVLFGLYHVNPLQGTYALLMGAVMAFLVWLTGSLGASMLFHMTSNLLVVFYSTSSALYDAILSPAGTVVTVVLGVAGILLLVLSVSRNRRAFAKSEEEGTNHSVKVPDENEETGKQTMEGET